MAPILGGDIIFSNNFAVTHIGGRGLSLKIDAESYIHLFDLDMCAFRTFPYDMKFGQYISFAIPQSIDRANGRATL